MAKQAAAAGAQGAAAKKKKKIQVDVTGKVFIKAKYNDVIVTMTDVYGNVISWSTAGRNGFKGSRKNTPFAAQVTAEAAADSEGGRNASPSFVFSAGWMDPRGEDSN